MGKDIARALGATKAGKEFSAKLKLVKQDDVFRMTFDFAQKK
jgi:hypothetical protein